MVNAKRSAVRNVGGTPKRCPAKETVLWVRVFRCGDLGGGLGCLCLGGEGEVGGGVEEGVHVGEKVLDVADAGNTALVARRRWADVISLIACPSFD